MNNSTDTAVGDNLYYKLIKFLHSIIVSIRHHFILFIVCMAIGIGLMLFKNFNDAKLYKATFTVAYDELFRKIYGDRLEKINSLVQKDNYKKIADLLKLDEQTVSALKNIEGKNILGEDLDKDLNTDQIPFIIELVVNDSSAITKIQDSVVSFLETGNDFLSKRKKIKLQEIDEELTWINQQLYMLDSINRTGKSETVSISISKGSKQSNTPDKTVNSLYEFSYELYKRKQELLRKQRMPQSLLIVDDAIVSVKNKKPAILMVIVGGFIGFFLYSLFAGLILPVFKFKEKTT
ncbi:MAG: hypothetical protein JST82_06665 [Bacteroidetes bacterium]|nr:hypothetical protein [Bacteroidota bacterium]